MYLVHIVTLSDTILSGLMKETTSHLMVVDVVLMYYLVTCGTEVPLMVILADNLVIYYVVAVYESSTMCAIISDTFIHIS